MSVCRECQEECGEIPSSAPPDWKDLCPHCAFLAMAQGKISAPSRDFLLACLKATITDAIGIVVQVESSQDDHPALRDDTEIVALGSGMMGVIHGQENCEEATHGAPCPFHSPTDHHMKDWPMHGTQDEHGYNLLWRLCPHDALHPDPDFVEFIRRAQELANDDDPPKLHHGACDGCCRTP